MEKHVNGGYTTGRSQFKYCINAEKLVLDAAAYADENNLWEGLQKDRAKVFVTNGVIGYSNGQSTQWLNVYRKKRWRSIWAPTTTEGKQ